MVEDHFERVMEPYDDVEEIDPEPEGPRWHAHEPRDTLGAGACLAAFSLGLALEGDDVEGACAAIGADPIRAAGWLRARGATVAHAVSRTRLSSLQASDYARASGVTDVNEVKRPSTPPLAPGSRPSAPSRPSIPPPRADLSFLELKSKRLGLWLRPDRVALVLVGPSWPTWRGNDVHTLVVVAAGPQALTVFDPAGDGATIDLTFEELDTLRAPANAAWEVLLVERGS